LFMFILISIFFVKSSGVHILWSILYKANAAMTPKPKFQEGGAMPPQGPPQEGGGGGLEQALMQVVETQDPQLALQVCMKIAESMGLMQGGAPAGPGAPPAGPAGPPQGPPMGRYGMKLPKLSKNILKK